MGPGCRSLSPTNTKQQVTFSWVHFPRSLPNLPSLAGLVSQALWNSLLGWGKGSERCVFLGLLKQPAQTAEALPAPPPCQGPCSHCITDPAVRLCSASSPPLLAPQPC